MKHERNFTGADTGYEEKTPAECQAEAWADCLEMYGGIGLMAKDIGVSVSTVRRGLRGENLSENTRDKFRRAYHELLELEYSTGAMER